MIFKGLADKAVERVAGMMNKSANPDFSSIKVLWRKPETMELFGIPYKMNPQQSPKDLAPRLETSWIRLGYEGGWASPEAEEFVKSLGDAVPESPNEFVDLETWDTQEESPV